MPSLLFARHGHGKMTFVSGAIYEGLWQYDKMTGYGILKLITKWDHSGRDMARWITGWHNSFHLAPRCQ